MKTIIKKMMLAGLFAVAALTPQKIEAIAPAWYYTGSGICGLASIGFSLWSAIVGTAEYRRSAEGRYDHGETEALAACAFPGSVAALSCAYEAYKLYQQGKEAANEKTETEEEKKEKEQKKEAGSVVKVIKKLGFFAGSGACAVATLGFGAFTFLAAFTLYHIPARQLVVPPLSGCISTLTFAGLSYNLFKRGLNC